jgi:patatin-like phospholipase/acyl hydrolase
VISGEPTQPLKPNSTPNDQIKKKKLIKILSIDGGGIRGIIPAFILKNLEMRLKTKKLSECFDVMAGTSTGGIIVLLLNAPDTKGRPKYSALDVYQIYKSFGSKAFYQSPWQYIKSFNGWLDEKYSSSNIENLLSSYFLDIPLSSSITNVVIPSYDIGSNKPIFFNTEKSKKNNEHNFYMKDVARATSAAPTYFKPAKIKDFTNQEYIFVDGGVTTNNPTLDAWIYAREFYGKDHEYLIISIGTGTSYGTSDKNIYISSKSTKGGKIDWASDISNLLLYSASDVVDDQISSILEENPKNQYVRIQIDIDANHSNMDDASIENIEILEKYAEKLIYQYDQKLDDIAAIIESF